ncbi:sodium/proline symporter [Rhodobacteraceae bacterium 63075]|nr:sodium/proline symporter [Rhodobacteraceae bacterium 63075]
MTATIWTFVVVTLLVTLSGAAAVINKRETTEDYLLASRQVAPWLAALSTVATNNSGFMFIGMIAASYRLGIETVWMMVGWVIGDAIAWWRIYPRLRARSGAADTMTVTAILSTGPEGPRRGLVVVASALTFVFLGIYAAAQLKAGATALHALFGWHASVGIVIGAAIVILYSFAGGIRADIWTDAAQSAIMFFSIGLILIAGFLEIGGPEALVAKLTAQDPTLLGVWPSDLAFGPVLFVLGFVAAGLGTLGQPHLMTRIIAMDHTRGIRQARLFYFGWMIPFWSACILVGLYARAILPDLAGVTFAGYQDSTELALPLLTMELLPDIFVGVALAGLFAATVSTADSQIILCSGVVTQDMVPRWKENYLASKLATVAVLVVALVVAILAPASVFNLVLIAWSALGVTLGPVLFIRLFRQPLPSGAGLAMMAVGLVTVIFWHLSDLDGSVFKMLPGLIAAFATYWLSRVIDRRRHGTDRPGEAA